MFTDADWEQFAAENGTPELTAATVLGRELWSFVSEPTSREFYRILARKTRESGKLVSVPFRCDGPDCRRYMRMFIQPVAGNGLEFRSVLEREEKRERLALFDPQAPRSNQVLHICAWCKRVKLTDWTEAEYAVEQLRLFDEVHLPTLSHSICPNCEAGLESKIAAI